MAVLTGGGSVVLLMDHGRTGRGFCGFWRKADGTELSTILLTMLCFLNPQLIPL